MTKVVDAFLKFVQITRPRILSHVGWDFARLHGHFTFAHSEVADQRYRVRRRVQSEHTPEVNVLIHKSDDGSSNHPSTLYAGQEHRIGADELGFGRQFLN